MLLVGDWAPGNKQVRLISDATILLSNLEYPVLPLAHSFDIRLKAGPNLFSSELPSEAGQFVLTLANNHIMDYGLPGLISSLELIRERGFKACGAGNNIHEARRPIIVEDNGVKVGIIACCEAQFGVASLNSAGVAEFGPWVYNAISDLHKEVDAVIVSCHAAVEDSPWPSPYIRELYHSYIDAGAAVVHGHHAHVPQGYEKYGEGFIFYGMGNFAVDPVKWNDYPNGLWSIGAEIDFRSKPIDCILLTFQMRHQPDSDTIVIEESNDEEKTVHKNYLELCNHPLHDPDLFEALWQEVALRVYYHHGAEYMRFSAPSISGRYELIRKGLSILKGALLNRNVPSSPPSQGEYLLWYHMVACESHRQMLATALGVLGGELKDLRSEETRQLADEMMPWSRGVVPA